MTTQKQVWDNIAPEWHEFKKIPAEATCDFLKKQKGKILDLGSGSGRNMCKLKSGEIYLLDFSEKMIKLAKQKAKDENIKSKFYISKMNKIPFDDNFFDAAICISSLHCVKTPLKRKQSVQELYRVLKKGAHAKIGVWNIGSKRFKNSKKDKMIKWRNKGERYYYLYDEKEVHDLFKKIGFKILKTDNTEMMINFIIKK